MPRRGSHGLGNWLCRRSLTDSEGRRRKASCKIVCLSLCPRTTSHSRMRERVSVCVCTRVRVSEHAHDGVWETLIRASPAIDKGDLLLLSLFGHGWVGYYSCLRELWRGDRAARVSMRLWRKDKLLVPAKAQLRTLLKFLKHRPLEWFLLSSQSPVSKQRLSISFLS